MVRVDSDAQSRKSRKNEGSRNDLRFEEDVNDLEKSVPCVRSRAREGNAV